MKHLTDKVRAGHELPPEDILSAAEFLLGSVRPDEDKADFLQALHQRGETPAEVRTFAAAFLEKAEPFAVANDLGPVLDVCGTGGDKLGLFNVSTAVMFVAAGAGARLVKHGNRGITSKSGGADVLEALAIAVEAPMERLHGMLEEAGAVFLFAPQFHPAFKSVAPARKILAERGSASVFNMLGPLLNPARPQRQLAGVFAEKLVPLYSAVLPELGREAAWVVHGRAGDSGVVDEISTLGPTLIAKTSGKVTESVEVTPEDLGVARADLQTLRGGEAADNARLLYEILSGERRDATRDLVMVNAAAAVTVAGLAGDWSEAMERAAESLDSGAARSALHKMQQLSRGR